MKSWAKGLPLGEVVRSNPKAHGINMASDTLEISTRHLREEANHERCWIIYNTPRPTRGRDFCAQLSTRRCGDARRHIPCLAARYNSTQTEFLPRQKTRKPVRTDKNVAGTRQRRGMVRPLMFATYFMPIERWTVYGRNACGIVITFTRCRNREY